MFQKGRTERRSIRNLKIRSKAIGNEANLTYTIKTESLQKDDVILWYTDGLIENKNAQGKMFGSRTLKQVLEQCSGLSASGIKNRIVEKAYQHYGESPRDDDVTLIVGKVK